MAPAGGASRARRVVGPSEKDMMAALDAGLDGALSQAWLAKPGQAIPATPSVFSSPGTPGLLPCSQRLPPAAAPAAVAPTSSCDVDIGVGDLDGCRAAIVALPSALPSIATAAPGSLRAAMEQGVEDTYYFNLLLNFFLNKQTFFVFIIHV